jgi:hypothetical protein
LKKIVQYRGVFDERSTERQVIDTIIGLISYVDPTGVAYAIDKINTAWGYLEKIRNVLAALPELRPLLASGQSSYGTFG